MFNKRQGRETKFKEGRLYGIEVAHPVLRISTYGFRKVKDQKLFAKWNLNLLKFLKQKTPTKLIVGV
jgi:hypothetical protein